MSRTVKMHVIFQCSKICWFKIWFWKIADKNIMCSTKAALQCASCFVRPERCIFSWKVTSASKTGPGHHSNNDTRHSLVAFICVSQRVSNHTVCVEQTFESQNTKQLRLLGPIHSYFPYFSAVDTYPTDGQRERAGDRDRETERDKQTKRETESTEIQRETERETEKAKCTYLTLCRS